jgi:hypothetical protein
VSTCARCGLETDAGELTLSGTCPGVDKTACRDREIAGLRSLLRSVTAQIERAHEWIDENPTEAKAELEAVLEVLS